MLDRPADTPPTLAGGTLAGDKFAGANLRGAYFRGLRWVLDHPQVTAVIPGSTRVEHVASNLAAATLPPLPATTHEAFHRFWAEQVDPLVRGPQKSRIRDLRAVFRRSQD